MRIHAPNIMTFGYTPLLNTPPNTGLMVVHSHWIKPSKYIDSGEHLTGSFLSFDGSVNEQAPESYIFEWNCFQQRSRDDDWQCCGFWTPGVFGCSTTQQQVLVLLTMLATAILATGRTDLGPGKSQKSLGNDSVEARCKVFPNVSKIGNGTLVFLYIFVDFHPYQWRWWWWWWWWWWSQLHVWLTEWFWERLAGP